MPASSSPAFLSRLKRDLGALEAYAAMIGMLVGAGVFKVTGVASALTGPGVILGYLILAPAVFATSVPYMVFASTPLGREPAGEYAHVTAVFGRTPLAFLCAWLKSISYLGALAYLAQALADYALELGGVDPGGWRTPLALLGLVFFYAVHVSGVRWFGRLQVGMCAVLGVSIAVLVVPGLFAIRPANLSPLLPKGTKGLLSALPPLFFAFAAFEALAHAGGEVKDSSRRLPRVFGVGIATTTLLFVSMSLVAFGALPYAELAQSEAPLATAAAVYLPRGAAELVTLGGVLAVATSLNATMLVPARLGLVLASEGLVPSWLGRVHAGTGTPVLGLSATFVIAAGLLLSGQLALALGIAVLALVIVYTLNSLALLCLPRRNPELFSTVTVSLSHAVQRFAAVASIAAMGTLIVVLGLQDASHVAETSLAERLTGGSLTSFELLFGWSFFGLVVYAAMARRIRR